MVVRHAKGGFTVDVQIRGIDHHTVKAMHEAEYQMAMLHLRADVLIAVENFLQQLKPAQSAPVVQDTIG